MLFLAVFCGFLAELQLEHKVEKDREKQFIKSLLYDLKKDSLLLSYNLQIGPRIVQGSGSLLFEFKNKPARGNEKNLYHLYSLLSEGLGLKYYDRTAVQLRNSRAFRLIKKQNVSDAILNYDVLMRNALSYHTSIESWSFVGPALEKFCNLFDIEIIFNIHGPARKFIDHTDSIPFPPGLRLLTYDPAFIEEFTNLQRLAQLTDEVKLRYSIEAFEKNRLLDSLIRKEYRSK